jgi:5-methylcytosine-specific restriction endonuclease McrA
LFRCARWRSQACSRGGALEVHHVVKRAQGGSDFDLDRLLALCPPCHAQTDAPYARGRLVIIPLGEGRFTCEVTRGADKWAIRA